MSPFRVWSNTILVIFAVLPALIEYYIILRICPHPSQHVKHYTNSLVESTCNLSNYHPLLLVNVLLLVNEGVYLWLLGLLQDST